MPLDAFDPSDVPVDPAAAPVRWLPRWSVGLGLALYTAIAAALAAWGPVAPGRPAPDVFLLDRELPRASVVVASGGSERACEWRAADGRFSCGGEGWAFVGPLAGTANGEPIRCTWMHPLPGGATTVLRFADTGFGSQIDGRLVLLDPVGEGAEVRVRVLAAGAQVADAAVDRSRAPTRFSAKLPPGVPRGELRIELRAPDHHDRHACLVLQMTGKRPLPMPPPDTGAPAGAAPEPTGARR